MVQGEKITKITEVGRRERVSLKKIFEAAGRGRFPLFVPAPKELKARLIDVASGDLVSRTAMYSHVGDDEAIPKLLRLKPADCARLAEADGIEVSDFPYAVCPRFNALFDQLLYEEKVREGKDEWQKLRLMEVPQNQELYPGLLDSALVCWRLFDPGSEGFSAPVPLKLGIDSCVISVADVSAVADLRRIGSKNKGEGEGGGEEAKDGRKDRHEVTRQLLMKAAEQVALDAQEGECCNLKSWANQVFELRETMPFNDVLARKKEISLDWVKKVLSERYEFEDGKPIRKKFTSAK